MTSWKYLIWLISITSVIYLLYLTYGFQTARNNLQYEHIDTINYICIYIYIFCIIIYYFIYLYHEFRTAQITVKHNQRHTTTYHKYIYIYILTERSCSTTHLETPHQHQTPIPPPNHHSPTDEFPNRRVTHFRDQHFS